MTANGSVFAAAAILTRHCAIRPRLRQAIDDSLAGQPRARTYDEDGSSPTPWCWRHERDITACAEAGELCDGETIDHPDPTSTAATTFDRARNDQRELADLERRIVDLTDQLARIASRYLPDRLPDKAARAKLATPGDPGCAFCEQAGTWSPPHTRAPTTVGGNLTHPRLVCSGHYDLIRKHLGRAPTRQENEAYVHRGKYPKVKAS